MFRPLSQALSTFRRRTAFGSLLAGFCLLLELSGAAAATFDVRNREDLQTVIMLCATEPGSPRFDSAWREWVVKNPDADLDGAIDTVISRAGTFRSMAVPGMEPVRPASRPDPARVAEHMRRLAATARRAAAAAR